VLCEFAERVKRDWLNELGMPDNWRDPIVLVVAEHDSSRPAAAPSPLEIYQNEIHLKYQLRRELGQLNEAAFVNDVVHALCAEFANRDQPVTKSRAYVPAPIPPWLADGLTQEILGHNDLLLAAAQRSLGAGRPQTASEILRATSTPDDEAMRELFEANAWLFAESLIALHDGPHKLRRLLLELGAQKSATNAFWTVYRTDFSQTAALEKWWAIQLTSRAAAQVAQNFTATQTAQRLDEILPTKLMLPAGKRGARQVLEPIAQLWIYYEQPWLPDVLREKRVSLELLRALSHPLYRDVIQKYADAIKELQDRKLNRFRRAVAKAETDRARVDAESQNISAYLDGAERAFAANDWTGTFTNYFATMNQLERLEQQRRSPISDYLDKFDK
jgi:hypothetical protein